jgi:hypothetical protein
MSNSVICLDPTTTCLQSSQDSVICLESTTTCPQLLAHQLLFTNRHTHGPSTCFCTICLGTQKESSVICLGPYFHFIENTMDDADEWESVQGASNNHLDATQNDEDEWESDSSYSGESEGLSSAAMTESMHFPPSPSWSPAKSESWSVSDLPAEDTSVVCIGSRKRKWSSPTSPSWTPAKSESKQCPTSPSWSPAPRTKRTKFF